MPRIRTLKPEHRQHRKVGALDHITYRLWVGMILEADDEGRLVYDPEALRVLIFGYHVQVSRAIVERSANILEQTGLIRRYVADGQAYAVFPSWRDHQRIDHASPSKFPSPNDSTNAREYSTNARECSRGIGSDLEGKGKDLKPIHVGLAPDVPSLTTARNGAQQRRTDAKALLSYLNHRAGRNYQPGAANLGFIEARLKEGATVRQCRSIIGIKAAKWKGDPKMDTYLRPATLFNREKFAQYLGELPASAFESTGEED